ncbi:MAG: hypothetical protein H7336_04265 [Bacteriovorax sp.]|nr:hypothetical protein [Bacteriovorax sp.]
MKKLLLAATILAACFNASAASVFIFPTCNAFQGECTIYNSSGKDINCNIQLSGMTQKGRPVNAFEYRMLYQGMIAWIRVFNTDANDPITSLQGTANCNTIN